MWKLNADGSATSDYNDGRFWVQRRFAVLYTDENRADYDVHGTFYTESEARRYIEKFVINTTQRDAEKGD